MVDWYKDEREGVKQFKRIPIQYVVPGMVTARDVVSSTAQLIFPIDMVLTEKAIHKLKTFNIDTIYVYKDDIKKKIHMGYSDEIKESRAFKEFSNKYRKSLVFVKNTLTNMLKPDDKVEVDQIIGNVEDMISGTNNNIGVFQMIHCIKKFDDDTFAHSINVSLMCSVFANWMGMSEREKSMLILGGVFHDVGKMLIPKTILKKTGKLSNVEYDIIKLHTTRGYEFLQKKNVPMKVKRAALNHHERYNGSGYPNHIKGNAIDDFSSIVAIADVFEAMTSKRVYHESLCPFEVIRFFEKDGYLTFNPKFLIPIIEKIAETYIGHTVLLNNGQEGEVIQINKYSLSRPVVRFSNNELLDLSTTSNLSIVDVF